MISSHRNWCATVRCEVSARRTSAGQPASSTAGGGDVEQPREVALLGGGEGEFALADLDAPPGHAQPRQRNVDRHPSAEHDVTVAGQLADDLSEQHLRRRSGELVDVIDVPGTRQSATSAASRQARHGRARQSRAGSRPIARQQAATNCAGSSSSGWHDTHASMPSGAVRFWRIAWANSVVFPNPAPATSVVTGRSKRPARSVRSRPAPFHPSAQRVGRAENERRPTAQWRLRERCRAHRLILQSLIPQSFFAIYNSKRRQARTYLMDCWLQRSVRTGGCGLPELRRWP